MVKYCKQDVVLLEKVYTKMLPYINSHPNLSIFSADLVNMPVCKKCGSPNIVRNGKNTRIGKINQTYLCRDCNGSSQIFLKESDIEIVSNEKVLPTCPGS